MDRSFFCRATWYQRRHTKIVVEEKRDDKYQRKTQAVMKSERWMEKLGKENQEKSDREQIQERKRESEGKG